MRTTDGLTAAQKAGAMAQNAVEHTYRTRFGRKSFTLRRFRETLANCTPLRALLRIPEKEIEAKICEIFGDTEEERIARAVGYEIHA